MTEAQTRLISLCKDFVRSMVRAEQAILATDGELGKEERREALREVLEWLTTTEELPPNSFAREIAREILGQLSAASMYDDYAGSPDGYIL
jgi:superfamily II DNA helicase RecQ